MRCNRGHRLACIDFVGAWSRRQLRATAADNGHDESFTSLGLRTISDHALGADRDWKVQAQRTRRSGMLVRAPHGGPTLFMPSGLLRTGAQLLLFRRLYRVRKAISRFETSEVDSSGEPGRNANPGLSQRFAELSNGACCSSIQGAGVAATGAGVGTSVQASKDDEAGARPFLSAHKRSSSCCRRMSLSKSRVDQLPPNLRAARPFVAILPVRGSKGHEIPVSSVSVRTRSRAPKH